MKTIMTLALALCTIGSVSAQTAPTDSEIDAAYQACHRHRDASSPSAVMRRVKSWQPGWEKCSEIQDAWDAGKAGRDAKARSDKEVSDKAAVEALHEKLTR